MKSQSKRDLILESIIEAYLLDNTPIGSNELNSNLCIPASTIRVYLKRLSDEGLITQIHISSGRIPAVKTMQTYWQNELNISEELQIKNADFLGKQVNLIFAGSVYTNYKKILKQIKEVA